VELAMVGLDYGIHLAASIKDEPFQPALITRDLTGQNQIIQLVAAGGKIDDAFSLATGQLRGLPAPAAAAVMDGNVTLDGEQFDAVIVRVAKPGLGHSHEFAQRYRKRGFRGRRLERLGNPVYAGHAPALFT